MSWRPTLNRIEEPRNAGALRDVHPLLRQLIEAVQRRLRGAATRRQSGDTHTLGQWSPISTAYANFGVGTPLACLGNETHRITT
jgi:hypothetical protein